MAQAALIAIPMIMGAQQQQQAGKIRKYESEVDAAQIETAAAQREADRRDALSVAISSQSAASGASGISFEGSPLAVLEEDVRLADEGSERDALMAKLGSSAARTRGKIAEAQAKQKAELGLLRGAASMAGTVGGGGGSGGGASGSAGGGIGFGSAGSAGAGKFGG